MENLLLDRYESPIFPGMLVSSHNKVTFSVIVDPYLGICLEDTKTKTLEMLTEDVARELEVVDERIYA